MCMLSHFSHVWLFAALRTVAPQAPLSMGFSRQEYWSGLPCPPSGDLPNPGIEPRSPTLQADSLPSEPPGKARISRTEQRMVAESSEVGCDVGKFRNAGVLDLYDIVC